MNFKRTLIITTGVFCMLSVVTSNLLHAQTPENPEQIIVIEINAAEFMGRYNYQASISHSCDFLLKEINPRCPDQRGEISFNVADVRAEVDATYNSLIVRSPTRMDIIKQRLYYRGSSVKSRRFCEAPEGSTLKSEDKMHSQKPLFYSENALLLGNLAENINVLGEACREETG